MDSLNSKSPNGEIPRGFACRGTKIVAKLGKNENGWFVDTDRLIFTDEPKLRFHRNYLIRMRQHAEERDPVEGETIEFDSEYCFWRCAGIGATFREIGHETIIEDIPQPKVRGALRYRFGNESWWYEGPKGWRRCP